MRRKALLYTTLLMALAMSVAGTAAFGQWSVGIYTLPSDIAWDASFDSSVRIVYSGGSLAIGEWAMVPIEGSTTPAQVVDRWGRLYSDPNSVAFTHGYTYDYDFSITGPALTTLQYTAPVGVTAPGVPVTVDCNWLIASPYTPTATVIFGEVSGPIALQDTVVSRFPDVGQAVVGWYWIEQLAGRVPLVVKGYPAGTYGPTLAVDRQQMAIFMARALNLPLLAYAGTFTDVTTSVVGWEHIEALARANVVQGFSPTVYAPTGIVSREQMAIFVARGMAGGDGNVPSGPAVPTFSDVALTDVSYKYVEYCAANDVVQGFSATIYGPLANVTREQMAIFVWRGFMMSTGVPVVIGGPACTGVEPDPAVSGYLGWSSVDTDPSWAYVALDALRIDWNLAVVDGPTTAWDIVLEVRAASAPTGAAVASTSVALSQAQITTIWNAAKASGDPYLIVKWDLSAEGLAAGDYILVALVEDSSGALQEVGWKRAAGTYVGRFFPFTVS